MSLSDYRVSILSITLGVIFTLLLWNTLGVSFACAAVVGAVALFVLSLFSVWVMGEW